MIFIEELLSFTGRWHPVLVHLPIGMLFLAFLFAVFARFERYRYLSSAIPFSLLFGAGAAIVTCITGYLLSLDGGYDTSVLSFHQWLGIAVAVLSFWTYALYRSARTDTGPWAKLVKYRFFFLITVVALLGATGHFGGTLTHGKGYMKDALPAAIKEIAGIQAGEEKLMLLENVQEAPVYDAIIQPILQQRCQSCHGDKKQEGGLALHNRESILKGGEEGSVLTAGKPDKSELYARLILPEGHEGRMPPKGRTPISAEQIQLIGWWIEQGADFERKTKDLKQNDKIAAILKNLEEGDSSSKSAYAALPDAPSLPEDAIQQLQLKGIKVIPLSADNNYVMVNAINYPEFSDADMQDLLKMKDNIIQLKLGHTAISDKALSEIAKLPVLMKLHLEHTDITNEGLKYLKGHKNLYYINLYKTKVSDEGLSYLQNIPKLEQVYVYQTGVTPGGIDKVRQTLSKSHVDTGNYQLPFLATDTTRYQ
ncbi:c-type cytochrome domain-containing protein [Sphingobacterium spiritivorum]|uniref:c-type cytochrome domain-containing protein n=1 Tax=Sphingobacterium spiritivorum TaxID=258 RepID=UPI003DA2AB75